MANPENIQPSDTDFDEHAFENLKMRIPGIGGPKEIATFISRCHPVEIKIFLEKLSLLFQTRYPADAGSREYVEADLRNQLSFWLHYICKEPLKTIVDSLPGENYESERDMDDIDDLHV